MNPSPSDNSPASRSIRLWPGVIVVALQWLLWLVLPRLLPDGGAAGMLGGLGCGLVVILWWLFFSRAPWSDRLLILGAMVLGVWTTYRLVHPSIANGMMGLMLVFYSVPVLSLALVAGAALGRDRSSSGRRTCLLLAVALACGAMTLLRTDGITGGATSDMHWRWTPTAEERLMAGNGPTVPAATAPRVAETTNAPAWPGFRGPNRDGTARGVRFVADTNALVLKELWRQPVGPAWSSFAVGGPYCYTQEQRGEEETVSCYLVSSGALVWKHADPVRFWESNAGAGPRSTPTLARGRLYTLGATGVLNALEATQGKLLWTRQAATDTGAKVPEWGFAGSPLVLGDLVVVTTAGVLAAYDLESGTLRWTGAAGGWGYSSPHRATFDGIEQIVHLNGIGAVGVSPGDGKVLWTHAWKSDGIVQPAITADGDLLLGSGSGMGTGVGVHRVRINRDATGWKTEERWRSIGLKPYFSDFVVHQGHGYGFDGGMVACIDLADGKRLWKGGRYGHGQLIGLPDQELLLVLSERGEIAWVRATPSEFVELARFQALEGKTWNHPVAAGDVVLVRNDREMAAYRLPAP